MAEITVNGRKYELVTLDDLTLDEAIVVWDYAHLSLDQLPDLEGFHPGVTAALIHIAIARVEQGESARTIRQTVGKIKVAELEQIFADISEETEMLPPPDAPGQSSPSKGSGEASGTAGAPDQGPSPANGSGSRGSAIGATSDPGISAR
jgi:hypothetical protein